MRHPTINRFDYRNFGYTRISYFFKRWKEANFGKIIYKSNFIKISNPAFYEWFRNNESFFEDALKTYSAICIDDEFYEHSWSNNANYDRLDDDDITALQSYKQIMTNHPHFNSKVFFKEYNNLIWKTASFGQIVNVLFLGVSLFSFLNTSNVAFSLILLTATTIYSLGLLHYNYVCTYDCQEFIYNFTVSADNIYVKYFKSDEFRGEILENNNIVEL